MAPGFEPAPLEHESSPLTTRPGLPPRKKLFAESIQQLKNPLKEVSARRRRVRQRVKRKSNFSTAFVLQNQCDQIWRNFAILATC